MITLKTMLIHASDQLRQDTARKTQIMLARHLASLRPARLETPDDSIRHTLRSLARRWLALDAEATELE
jgi:transposase